MPPQRRKTKSRRAAPSGPSKRRFRRRRAPKRTKLINRGPSVIPDRYYTKLNYAEDFSVTTSTSYNNLRYHSSLYDPNDAGAGHQPMGFDQLATLYDKYIVFGFKYVVAVVNQGTTPVRLATVLKNTATASTTITQIMEKPYNVARFVSPGEKPTILKGYCSVAKIFGVPNKMVNRDDKFNSATTNSPAQTAYLYIYQDTADAITSNKVVYTVKLTFYACFYDRIPLAQS